MRKKRTLFLLAGWLLFFPPLQSIAKDILYPLFIGKDEKREKLSIALLPVARGIKEPTDIQFIPGQPKKLIVTGKRGSVFLVDLENQTDTPRPAVLFSIPVRTKTEEMGLLGFAFHPRFPAVPKVYVNYTPLKGRRRSHISEWTLQPPSLKPIAKNPERILLKINQPSNNHKGGQLAFGPNGHLYIGLGDGGPPQGDPLKNAQNPKSLLGKILRIDVDKQSPPKPYAIPEDNPFIGSNKFLPEIWAYGFRNPWRFSFDPAGRLWVADVGEKGREELSAVEKGKNYGWNIREGSLCFKPPKNCANPSLNPWYEYGRDEGASITGGYVYLGKSIPALSGKYVFGDFIEGRIWGIQLSDSITDPAPQPIALGKWPHVFPTFGRDADGEIYVADFGSGTVFRLTPAP